MNGVNFIGQDVLKPNNVVDPVFRIAGVRDFNSDGKPDLIWESNDGYHVVWFMDGVNFVNWAPLHQGKVDPQWRLRMR
jgi:hypothetical protein